jgi:hypothetical protein
MYALRTDPKQPVRLTAAAAYLRTTGAPGPGLDNSPAPAPIKGKRLTTPSTTRPAVAIH